MRHPLTALSSVARSSPVTNQNPNNMLDNKRPLDGDAEMPPSKKQKQDELILVVDDLWRSKSDPTFPVKCYDTITRSIASFLDREGGSFVLPLQEAPGKKLSTVLQKHS